MTLTSVIAYGRKTIDEKGTSAGGVVTKRFAKDLQKFREMFFAKDQKCEMTCEQDEKHGNNIYIRITTRSPVDYSVGIIFSY